MTAKLDPFAAAPELMKTRTRTSMAIASSLEPKLVELVKIRASQINGCANCIDMHTAEARANGETEQRIYLLSAWREAPAANRPIFGFDPVMKLHESLAAHFRKNASKLVRAGFVNGLPGFVTLEADGEPQTTALEIEDGKVVAIYIVRNPDKLRHLH